MHADCVGKSLVLSQIRPIRNTVKAASGNTVKIKVVEAFQVSWAPADKPEQRSAWVRIHCDDGSFGIGEASPMQGGLASLGIIERNLGSTDQCRSPRRPCQSLRHTHEGLPQALLSMSTAPPGSPPSDWSGSAVEMTVTIDPLALAALSAQAM